MRYIDISTLVYIPLDMVCAHNRSTPCDWILFSLQCELMWSNYEVIYIYLHVFRSTVSTLIPLWSLEAPMYWWITTSHQSVYIGCKIPLVRSRNNSGENILTIYFPQNGTLRLTITSQRVTSCYKDIYGLLSCFYMCNRRMLTRTPLWTITTTQ